MKNKIKYHSFCLFLLCMLCSIHSGKAQIFNFTENFQDPTLDLKITGRGDCHIINNTLSTKDAYVNFGDSCWSNYRVSFRARAPQGAGQVQIWAGFRAFNRFDRYIIGLKGGLQDDLYLSRMGYMGTDEFLGLRELDFHPEPGTWYDFKIEVCGNRIRVFLNDNDLPYIDVTDKNSNLAPSGAVTLGGGWIETEFADLSVTSLPEDYLKDIPVKEYSFGLSQQQKETKRKAERDTYSPVTISHITDNRMEISLDGNWLFMPTYESDNTELAVSPDNSDANWHMMHVPDFWNPIRIWLHGETFGPHAKGVSDTYFQMEARRCETYTFDYKKTKAAWYRQWVELPEGIAARKTVLNFDAVSKVAEVYINGTKAGDHIGMFGDFEIDATGLLKPGKNLIAVKVVRDFINNIEDGDKVVDVSVTVPVTNKMLKDIAHGFYCGDQAGIWQPVKLVISNPVKIEDVFIKPSLTGAEFDLTVKNHSSKKASLEPVISITDAETQHLLYEGKYPGKVELKAGEEKTVTWSVENLKPYLWTPQNPNLYDFRFALEEKNKTTDAVTITSGFRTFTVGEDGLFHLNGVPYWLRGGNHTPFALAPNDLNLANTFYQLMKAGNIDVTRTHTTPYNKLWIDAADKNGIGISHEGTWPWLMILGSMPEQALIDMWADEYLDLLKKYRNHPSILFWTINNEMKFYDNDPDFESAKRKMKIISDVVKRMREIDPTRPISFDSNYRRKEDKFGKDFYTDIDDGDIDDVHAYINWYDYNIFRFFNGEFQKSHKNPGRPLISQEMSTGYPNNETGHPTRFYTLVHQNPQTLIGYEAYAYGNPDSFLEVQGFITGELAEALRRSNDDASGILHFALLTWFRSVYDYKNIDPYPTYYALKRGLQPVLVSAELWGRNFYAGEKIPTRIYVVNDLENGRDLDPCLLYWTLEDERGNILTSGKEEVPATPHYKRQWLSPEITIPNKLPENKTKASLKLKLTENGVCVSENEYKLLLAKKEWSSLSSSLPEKTALVDFDNTGSQLDFLGIPYKKVSSVSDVVKNKWDVVIISGLEYGKNFDEQEKSKLRDYISRGGKVLLLNSPDAAIQIYPEYITGKLTPSEGDIVNMEIPESSVFDDIGSLELRYFNNNKREMPKACYTALQVNRNENVIELANQTKIHGYINGEMEQRSEYVKTIKGFPILKIRDKGAVIISTMATDKASTDPVAGRLLSNMIHALAND